MRKLFFTAMLFAMVCVLALRAQSQVTVTGNLKNLGHANVTPQNTFVRFRLNGFGAFLPTVDDGSGVIVSEQQDFKSDIFGNINGPLVPNDLIRPRGTFYQACVYFQGIQFRCSTYLVNSGPSTFNMNTAPSLTTVPAASPNQLVLQTFPCVVSVAATTWTCTHNFNDSPVMVSVYDATGKQIFPDTVNVSNLNVATLTFVTPQAGTALISHAGAITLATNQPNAVLQNPTAPQVIQGPFLIIGATTGLTGTLTVANVNGDVYMDGVKYATIAAALAAIPSGGTVRISAGTFPITSTLNMVSNLDIECSPNNSTILQASTSLNAPMISATSINNFRLAGCVVDGNRGTNQNQVQAIVLSAAKKSHIVGNHFQNFTGGRLIHITNGSNFNTIQDNEIDHYGLALPAPANGSECIALDPSGSGAGVQDNDIIHNFCHDGNGGIGVYNSNAAPSVTTNTSRNRILYNKIQSNPNDAFLVFSQPTDNPLGSLIQGNLFEGNIARCNGWPANGTGWDTTNCPPGLLQTGSSAGQGVGFNMNSGQGDQNQFIGNRGEFNFFEGGDDTPEIFATVNTSNGALGACTANCVQATSGGPFNTSWKTNSTVNINNVFYLVSSVQSSTILTLTTAPGTQSGVLLTGYQFSRSIWKGNYFYNNGNGAPAGGQGSGLALQGGYVTSSGNTSAGNAFSGFFDQGAVYVTHDGDHSLFNCRVAICNEFNVQAALSPTHIGVVSDSNSGNGTLFWDRETNNGFAESPSLCAGGNCGNSFVQDQGTNDIFSNGRTRGAANTNGSTHSLCFAATGGTGCVNYGGGPGGFNLTLPGVNGTLSPLIAQDCGTTTTCSATNISATVKIIKGSVALTSGTPSTATVTGFNPPFSSTGSFICTASNATTQANSVKVVNASTSSITITGPATVTDTVNYTCIGN